MVTASVSLKAASVSVRAPVQTAVRRAPVVSRDTNANVTFTCALLCIKSYLDGVHSIISCQEVNVTTCVPTRCVCQGLQCVMVLLTAKTTVMNSTVPEHVSARDISHLLFH